MNNKVLNKLIRDQMHYDRDYSYHCLFGIYNEIMGRDYFVTQRKLKYSSFRRLVSTWASVDDGWLRKEGDGQYSRFSKRYPPCPYLLLERKLKEAIGRLWAR